MHQGKGKMTEAQKEWTSARDELVRSVAALGFPEELGNEIARNLGSPKAMYRMMAYLDNVRPKKVELVVDEMLAIRSEIETWREKKASQEAQAGYSAWLDSEERWQSTEDGD